MVQAFWLGVFGKFELEQGPAKTVCHELLKFWRLDLIVSKISYFFSETVRSLYLVCTGGPSDPVNLPTPASGLHLHKAVDLISSRILMLRFCTLLHPGRKIFVGWVECRRTQSPYLFLWVQALLEKMRCRHGLQV